MFHGLKPPKIIIGSFIYIFPTPKRNGRVTEEQEDETLEFINQRKKLVSLDPEYRFYGEYKINVNDDDEIRLIENALNTDNRLCKWFPYSDVNIGFDCRGKIAISNSGGLVGVREVCIRLKEIDTQPKKYNISNMISGYVGIEGVFNV